MSGYTDDQLHAYVDGLLGEDERAAIEAWLATSEDAAAREPVVSHARRSGRGRAPSRTDPSIAAVR